MAYARQPTLDENCPAQTRMMIAVTLCHSKEDPGPWRGQSKCTASAVPAPCGNFEDVQHCRAKADPMRVVAGVAVAGPVIAAAEAASGKVDGRGGCYVMLGWHGMVAKRRLGHLEEVNTQSRPDCTRKG
jgi:hypothetical protein